MEIFINECDWAGKASRMSEIIERLSSNGWERFGHNGAVVFFKDVNEEAAKDEMKKIGDKRRHARVLGRERR